MAKHTTERKSVRNQSTALFEKNQSATKMRATSGPVRYMDGGALNRPLSMPRKLMPFLAVICAIALVLGVVMARNFNHSVVHSSDRTAERVEKIINRGIEQQVPILTGLLWCDDATLLSSFDDAGFTYVDMNEINGTTDASLDILKLPSDMSVEEADSAYTKGISSLDSDTAAKLLSGCWRFTVVRDDGFSYTVKYADFSSETGENAVKKAVEAQGFADSEVTESGVDDNGNTYENGTIEVDEETYNWSVSACNINDVYSVTGLPENAQYVGVRIYR